MASKKPPIKNQILEDYLISSSHDIKSIGGLIVSGIISTFGVYSIIKPFFEEGSNSLNIALFSFIIVLIIFDTVKRGALTKFFNSLLKKKIINSKAKKGYLIIAVFATIFMVLLDGLGSWSTAEKGANLYTQFKTNSSTEYKILQQNAESGKAVASNYTLELKTWEESKKDAQTTCNEKWNGWKAKYKAKCKEEWNNAHPMPKQTTTGQIKIDDYKNIKNDQQSFLDEYLFIILFVLLSLMTLLMQYLTIAKIYDDYNEIEEGLTYERIQFINDTIQEHETIVAEHEQKTAEMMANSTREKKGQDRKFQEVGEAIAITHKKKMVDTRAETVKRIANNTYVPHEESKAGMILNPFDKGVVDVEYVEVNGEWKVADKHILGEIGANERIFGETPASTFSVESRERLLTALASFRNGIEVSLYRPMEGWTSKRSDRLLTVVRVIKKSSKEQPPADASKSRDGMSYGYIIMKLWRTETEQEAKAGDKLTPKKKIININKRKEVEKMSMVYKALVNAGYAELRGNKGYFALVDFEEIDGNRLV